jgi:hypothetical protein
MGNFYAMLDIDSDRFVISLPAIAKQPTESLQAHFHVSFFESGDCLAADFF